MWCLKFADCLVSAKGAARGACVNAVLLMHDASLFLGLVCCLFYFVLTKDVWGPFSVPVLSPFFWFKEGSCDIFLDQKIKMMCNPQIWPWPFTMTLHLSQRRLFTVKRTCCIYMHLLYPSIIYIVIESYYIILCNHEWPLNSAVYPHHIPIMTLVIDVGWASPYSPCLVDLGGISCWNIPYTPYICECCV